MRAIAIFILLLLVSCGCTSPQGYYHPRYDNNLPPPNYEPLEPLYCWGCIRWTDWVYPPAYYPPPYMGFVHPEPDQWQPLTAPGELVVYVKRNLFELPDRQKFYVLILIQNTTSHGIAVDLRDYSTTVRPMQWGPCPREKIAYDKHDYLPPTPARRQQRQQLLCDFYNERLVEIPPKSAVGYFHDFGDANTPASLPANNEKLCVVLAGRIWGTDGRDVLKLMVPIEASSSRVALNVPPQRLAVPIGHLILETPGPAVLSPEATPMDNLVTPRR